jgi:hypothetical protein
MVDAGADAGTNTGSDCPRVTLGTTLPVEYSGDTTSLPNLVTSARLEWTDAPDDAVKFTAPVAGKYLIELTSSVTELGASAEDYNNGNPVPFSPTACPAAGVVKEIDGVFTFNQPNYPLDLAAGESIVIFVSAPSFAQVKAGPYMLKVSKLP